MDGICRTHGQLIFSLSGHLHHVTCLALGSDDNTVVSGSKDKTIWVWNLRLGNPVKTMEGHTGTVTSLAVFDEGPQLDQYNK
jgi:WD40 repeat protein